MQMFMHYIPFHVVLCTHCAGMYYLYIVLIYMTNMAVNGETNQQ